MRQRGQWLQQEGLERVGIWVWRLVGWGHQARIWQKAERSEEAGCL